MADPGPEAGRARGVCGEAAAADEMLAEACRAGRVEEVARLLAAGVPVGKADARGYTPLHKACLHDRPEIVARLLAKDAEIECMNDRGHTPLRLAVASGGEEVVA